MAADIGFAKFNMPPFQAARTDASAAVNSSVSTSRAGVSAKPLHPDNPSTWLFGIGAVTLGLIYVTRPSLHASGSLGLGK